MGSRSPTIEAARDSRLAAGWAAPVSTVAAAIRSAVDGVCSPVWPVLNSRQRSPSDHSLMWVVMPMSWSWSDRCWLASSALRRSSVMQMMARRAPGREWRPYGPLSASQTSSRSAAVLGRSTRVMGSPGRKGTRTIDSSGLKPRTCGTAASSSSGD